METNTKKLTEVLKKVLPTIQSPKIQKTSVPALDAFGIVVIQVPLGQLLQVLLIMIGGN
ncbi:hypothetical protein ACR9H8_09385 [Kosakonia cowanii]